MFRYYRSQTGTSSFFLEDQKSPRIKWPKRSTHPTFNYLHTFLHTYYESRFKKWNKKNHFHSYSKQSEVLVTVQLVRPTVVASLSSTMPTRDIKISWQWRRTVTYRKKLTFYLNQLSCLSYNIQAVKRPKKRDAKSKQFATCYKTAFFNKS